MTRSGHGSDAHGPRTTVVSAENLVRVSLTTPKVERTATAHVILRVRNIGSRLVRDLMRLCFLREMRNSALSRFAANEDSLTIRLKFQSASY
jgi:hypothetical protein